MSLKRKSFLLYLRARLISTSTTAKLSEAWSNLGHPTPSSSESEVAVTLIYMRPLLIQINIVTNIGAHYIKREGLLESNFSLVICNLNCRFGRNLKKHTHCSCQVITNLILLSQMDEILKNSRLIPDIRPDTGHQDSRKNEMHMDSFLRKNKN